MYNAEDYSHLIGTAGFSDNLLNTHFGLYQGYVKNVNTLIEKRKTLEPGTPEFNELTRRFGWEFNGMRLHELYFGNMSKEDKKLGDDSPLYKKMTESFGSGSACKDAFVSAASLRGVGWTVTYYDKKADQLFHVWVDDHATNHLSGCTPLVVMDMWEHAFIADYGMKKKDYMEAFISAIDWEEVENRYKQSVG